MMHLIDSHCHLDFVTFDHDRDAVLTQCLNKGVNTIFVPAISANYWPRLLAVCAQSTQLHPALGMHPIFMNDHKPAHLEQLSTLLTQHDVIAVGEIGLDFYIPNHDKQAQIALFNQQLIIANEASLPVLLHVRKAHDQVIVCLKKNRVKGGIVHAFNGSIQQAEQYQKLGFLMGVGGAITHPNATKLRSLMTKLPLSSLVLETDAPDMPLFNSNNTRNTPENIPPILAMLAQLRSESIEEIAAATTANCQRVFAI
jgi:TatD DNase family protein